MRVKVNRDLCSAHLAFCERCMGKFLRHPMGYDRLCHEEIEEDGSDILTIELHSGDHDIVLKLNDEQRMMMADDGWTSYVDFAIPMYRVG